MFGPTTTAGLIDEYASRFTSVSGARFLIARAGNEAWPISEEDSIEFRERYRRRMMRARLIRRISLTLFPVLLVLGWQLPREPRWFIEAYQVLTVFALFAAPFFGSLQHKLTSDITREGIERQLERRISTGHEPAITPAATSLARMVRKTLILAGAILMAIEIGHMIGPREEFGGHMRVLTGLTTGNESLLARFTGTLTYMLFWTTLVGSMLLWLDRRKRLRAAAKSRPQAEKPSASQCDVEAA
jgi:preprotein translocase subunit SecG